MEAKRTAARWYSEREDVRHWQHNCEKEVSVNNRVHTLLGRTCLFPPIHNPTRAQKAHIARAAISTTVQVSLSKHSKKRSRAYMYQHVDFNRYYIFRKESNGKIPRDIHHILTKIEFQICLFLLWSLQKCIKSRSYNWSN